MHCGPAAFFLQHAEVIPVVGVSTDLHLFAFVISIVIVANSHGTLVLIDNVPVDS